MNLKKILQYGALAAALGTGTGAQAQTSDSDYPGSKPVRLLAPFPPGGGTDILSRLIAQKLTEQNQWAVVVENRPGAGGTIGITEAVKARPTGHDIVMGQKDNLVLGYYLYKNLPWNPSEDLTPIAHVAYSPVIIATAETSRFKTLNDVITAAKADPGKVTYGSPGNGTSIHIAGVLLGKATGAELTHVPYKGSNPALVDTLSGNVDLLVSTVPSAIGQIRAGKLRPLAVTSAKRSSVLPDVPTVAESGYEGFDVSTWYGLFGPRNLPAPIVLRLNAAVNKLLATQDVQAAIQAQGAEHQAMSAADFDQFFRKDFAAAKAIVESSGATIQ